MLDHPNKLMVLEYLPGKNLLMGVAELKNEIGALAEATSIVAKAGLNLTYSKTFALSGDDVAVWSFTGILGPNDDPNRIERALGDSPKVLACKIRVSDRGLILNDLQFPISIGEGERAMLVVPHALTSMFSRMTELLGSGGRTVLYEEGKAAGKERGRALQRLISRERASELAPMAMGLLSAMGWGRLQVLEKEPDSSRVVISIKENFEAAGVKAAGPNCQFTRGCVAGFISVLVDKDLSCEETKCLAAGDDACVFVLS